MSKQPRPPEVTEREDAHGKVYSATCPACGRQVAERQAAEVPCVCGARVNLKR